MEELRGSYCTVHTSYHLQDGVMNPATLKILAWPRRAQRQVRAQKLQTSASISPQWPSDPAGSIVSSVTKPRHVIARTGAGYEVRACGSTGSASCLRGPLPDVRTADPTRTPRRLVDQITKASGIPGMATGDGGALGPHITLQSVRLTALRR